MNRICIATRDKTLTIRMPDNMANIWFGTLCQTLLEEADRVTEMMNDSQDEDTDTDEFPDEYEPDSPGEPATEPESVTLGDTESTILPETGNIEQPRSVAAQREVKQSYTGFLRIKCDHCGKVKSFCTKQPIDQSRCSFCGRYTPLQSLGKLNLECECGSIFRYRTNETEKLIEQICLNCKSPVALERDKHGNYHTVKA